MRAIMRNIFTRKIQFSWKRHLLRMGQHGKKGQYSINRDQRRILTYITWKTQLLDPIIQQKSKRVFVLFLQDYFKNQPLKDKIFALRKKVVKMQRKFLCYFENKRLRHEIIKQYFDAEKMKMQAKYAKKKKAKEEKQLKNLKQTSIDAVISRYLRYCFDTYILGQCVFRQKIKSMNLNKTEQVLLSKSILIHKLHHRPFLTEEDAAKVEPDHYSVKIDKVVPCLDSNLKAKDRKDSTQMSMRVLYDNVLVKILSSKDEPFTIKIVDKDLPLHFVFFPT